MRAAKETATFSNQNIQVLAQSAESQIEAFENLLSGGMIVETYQSYCDVLTMIKRIRSEAKQYFDSVNSNKIEEFVDTISTLVS
ncbi:MAG: hypothetical protein ACD_50C00263G0001 [uncultured bacterium]|nr:MAG: hypothetical protein ACD_50C00263G0001 [uncultured bacterium]